MMLIEAIRSDFTRHERAKISDWEERRQVLLERLPRKRSQLTAESITCLGDYLSSAFQLPSHMDNRGQDSVSGGGVNWTALVSLYLNLCLAGTEAIALSGKFIPQSYKDALKVTYAGSGSTKLNSDLDIVVANVPGSSSLEAASRGRLRQFSALAGSKFQSSSVVVVQTKTNWNDSAQVPMLWNLIYKLARQGAIPENGVAVGQNQFHIRALKGFGYAFVTVPTQKDLEAFKITSTAVVRVRGLTCGAYWGRPTKNGVISSLREFFNFAYNRTSHCFPPPDVIGVAYADELKHPNGIVDVTAFDLVRPEGS
jgi:hypothetical protein